MTNEEKIQELLSGACWDSKPYLVGMDKIGVEDVMERFADWKDEQFAQEKQALIQKYEDKLNKLNQREEAFRDNVRRANSQYGFEGLF